MTAIAGVSARSRSDRGGRFLVPLVAVMALTSIYPAVYSLILSLFDWNWGQRLNFVGVANYVDVLGSERFRTALVNTVVFTVSAGSVPLLPCLGPALARNRVGRGGGG